MSCRTLAEGVCESIAATTPASSRRHAHTRFTWSGLIGWAVVAVALFIVLAMSSVPPR